MNDLGNQRCASCENFEGPLSQEEVTKLLSQVNQAWNVSEDGTRITRDFAFNDFGGALSFVKAVGDLAEEENHHPRIVLRYGKVSVSFSTHTLGALSENDFIMAAKCYALYERDR